MSEFEKQQVKITAMYKRCGSVRLGIFVTVGFSKKELNKIKDRQEFKRGFCLPF